MFVKVTDPCYVIAVDEWDRLCKAADAAYPADWVEAFERLVNEYLKQKTGKDWATAGGTGYGDWSNNMFGNGQVVKSDFYADAGMWCVVPAEFNERPDMGDTDGAAILKFDDNSRIEVKVLTDNNKEWTEFAITGVHNGYVTHVRSEPYRGEEDAIELEY
jgi:hypothetical protein